MSKCQVSLIIIYQKNNAALEKDIPPNNVFEKNERTPFISKSFGALLTDFSKAFDCLDQELLTVKLNADGFNLPALQLIQAYLSYRKQRTETDDSYSSWSEILFDISQGPILEPILFNIFLTNPFLIVKDIDIASYADDSTLFIVQDNIENLIASLEEASST